MKINLEDTDYTVLPPVKGSSTTTSYVCGVVQVVDGSKVSVLWVKFFEDQYSFRPQRELDTIDAVSAFYPPLWPLFFLRRAGYFKNVSAEDRAYYKALAATPDADVVLESALTKQNSGFPLLCSESSVTFTGKALKYKTE